jgi:hypothetical protein
LGTTILERAKNGGYDGVVLENIDEYGDGIEEENGRYPGHSHIVSI